MGKWQKHKKTQHKSESLESSALSLQVTTRLQGTDMPVYKHGTQITKRIHKRSTALEL